MQQTKHNNKVFYKRKWFKLAVLFLVYGVAFYGIQIRTNVDDLEELKVVTKGNYKSGSGDDPVKIYFNTKEYSNPFGVLVGGIYGRSTEVEKSLEDNTKITIKIQRGAIAQLNNTKEAISIYYLSNEEGLIFDENGFAEGEKSSANVSLIVLAVGFIFFLWAILK